MKLIGLAQLKTSSLLALLSVIGNLSFLPADLRAAEKVRKFRLPSGSISSSEETMRRCSLLGERLLHEARTERHHSARDRFSGYDPHHRCRWR